MSLFTKDTATRTSSHLFAFLCGAILLLIFSFLFKESLPALQNIGALRFFFDSGWYPEAHAEEGDFSVVAMVIASLAVSLLAISIALPLAILCALYTQFYLGSRLEYLTTRLLEVLAGIPSVLLGLWGIVFLAPLLAELKAPGFSTLCAALVLALMILPTIAILSMNTLREAHQQIRSESESLALTREAKILHLVLPMSAYGILVASVLGFTRAIGETMVVVMLCGNIAQIPGSIFDPVRPLTASIALEMAYAFGDHRSSLYFSGLLLLLLVSGLLLSAQFLRAKLSTEIAV